MGIILSITNQKGGVAKTTTAIHLAQGIARLHKNKKVLLIDLDSQRNASSVMIKDANLAPEQTCFPIFQGKSISSNQFHDSSEPNLMVIPASLQLVEVESLLSNAIDGFFHLNEAVEKLGNEFDFIIFDCPPSLSVITINAMVAAQHLIIPMQVSKFSIDGIQGITDAVNTVKKRYNPKLNILGALLVMYDARNTLSKAVVPQIQKKLTVFETTISKSVTVEEAHLLKENLFSYAPKSKVTQAYMNLAEELLSYVE